MRYTASHSGARYLYQVHGVTFGNKVFISGTRRHIQEDGIYIRYTASHSGTRYLYQVHDVTFRRTVFISGTRRHIREDGIYIRYTASHSGGRHLYQVHGFTFRRTVFIWGARLHIQEDGIYIRYTASHSGGRYLYEVHGVTFGNTVFISGTRRHIREDGILKHIFIFSAQISTLSIDVCTVRHWCQIDTGVWCAICAVWTQGDCLAFLIVSWDCTFLKCVVYWSCLSLYSVPRGKVNILGGHSIGHSKQKC